MGSLEIKNSYRCCYIAAMCEPSSLQARHSKWSQKCWYSSGMAAGKTSKLLAHSIPGGTN